MNNETNRYDVIIIGGGAAGMTAAIFTCRKKLRTLIVTIDVGGQNLLAENEENYPGYLDLSGPKLMSIFEKQAKKFGAEFVFGKVNKVEKMESSFLVGLANGESYEGRALILAYGKVPRPLGVPSEDKFMGRGISTCATCDAPLFKGKTVAVVGGGNSAIEAVELLTKFAKKVYLIHRRDAFRADEVTVEKLRSNKNVEFVLNSVPVEIKGEKFVAAVVVEDVKNKNREELKVDGVFIEIGYVVDTSFVRHLVEINENNEIVVNNACETREPGIFAAGDVTNVPYKQTVISAGMGATAGLSAYNYIMKIEGKSGAKIDWS
jgi:thioredoxin reductase (NADPH)